MQMFGVTGEALGTIGVKAEQQEREPEWKKLLNAKPSVSIRKGIARGDNPPTEPTSTLVLTSPQNRVIDIRFSLKGPLSTSPPHYWAFAGDCRSEFPSSDTVPKSTSKGPTQDPYSVSFPCSMHIRWTRFLDSHGDLTTPDQGTNFLLHNGDCLEIGHMSDPETGLVQSYQELWTSPPVADDAYPLHHHKAPRSSGGNEAAPPTPPTQPQPKAKVTVAILYRLPPAPNSESSDPHPTPNPTPNPDAAPKGMIMRIGSHCQGIIDIPPLPTPKLTDALVQVERWHLLNAPASIPTSPTNPSTESIEHNWQRDPSSDYAEDTTCGIWMPCLWVCEEGRGLGDVVERVGEDGEVARWRVVEVGEEGEDERT